MSSTASTQTQQRITWSNIPDFVTCHRADAGGGYWTVRDRGLSIIATTELHVLQRWLHVSFALPLSTPTYAMTSFVRRHWFPPSIQSIMVFPPDPDYVNLHPHCLHLYACLTPAGDGLPRFNDLADLATHHPEAHDAA